MASTTQAKINSFIATAVGRKFNPDHAFGFQCMDVFLDYAIALYGGPVNKTARPSNAKSLYDGAYATYWIKTRNDPKKATQLPKKGDVIVYGAARWNGWYGHTGIVESANKSGVTILMQDGILQTATKRKTFTWAFALPIGWLTPRVAASAKPKPAPVKIIRKGSVVRPIKAVSYEGTRLVSSVTKHNYTVIELKGKRAVLGNGLNTAFNSSNLKLIK